MILWGTVAGCLMPTLLGAAVNVDTGEGARGTPVVFYSFEPSEDLDYDDLPDDWVRRKGPNFPRYVKIRIDGTTGSEGGQSLRIDAHGSGAILYSPVTRIDSLHTYSFRGKVRTKDLWKDSAAISVSLLNHRRQRIQRFLTPVVNGNHDEWVDVEIPAMTPSPDVRFVVIGCHLLSGEEASTSGSAWFDELSFCRSPGMTLDGDFVTHFRNEASPVKVTARVSGLDSGHDYELLLEFLNAYGAPLEQRRDALPADDPSGVMPDGSTIEARRIEWILPKQEPGYYRLTSTLFRDGRPHLREATSLAVMRLVERQRVRGEFGWSLDSPPANLKPEILTEIAAQAGINRIKYPVWNSMRLDDPHSAGELAKFFEQLASRQIQTIGLLSDPPEFLRHKFARNTPGVSEIFSTQTSVWGPSVEPVVARFCSSIRHWQLGDENDSSFEGLAHLEETLSRAHVEINRIGLTGQIGVPWMHHADRPLAPPHSIGFVSLRAEDPENLEAMTAAWRQMRGGSRACWVLLEPGRFTADSSSRANQLVRQMVAAKMAGVEAIFVNGVFSEGHGLLNDDGSPSDLFLPWRTTALALQDSEFLGEIEFPQGSRNAVFARDNEEKEKEVIIVIWRDKPSETKEVLYLGENVVETDLWGRTTALPVSPETRQQTINVTTTPKILRGCSEPIARWRLATRFAAGNIRSEYGSHKDSIIGQNTFSLGVSGKVTLETPQRRQMARSESGADDENTGWQAEPREWTITAAAREAFQLPVFLTLPADADVGSTQMKLTFDITADRPYQFEVLCPYQVGSKDVTLRVIDRKLPDGRLEIEQIVTNSTSPAEVLDFRCSLMVPGARRQKVLVTKLGSGIDRKFYYLPDAESLRGKDIRLKLEQDGGGRVLNQKWTVGSEWE